MIARRTAGGLGVIAIAIAIGCGDGPGGRAAATTPDGGASTSAAAADHDTAGSEATDDRGDDTGVIDDTSDGGPIDPPDDPDDPDAYAPEVYPPDRVHSPITPWVADRLREIAASRPERFEDVFMKVGASSTVSPNTLHCFAGGAVDLGRHGALDPTLQFFLGGDAAGSTPFDRVTLAAEVGRTAGWAITGDPSPVQAELDGLSPRLALVHYGANDMGAGATYAAALQGFFSNMSTLFDVLEDQGVVPIAFGITRRGDSASAQRWVGTWNATIRGLAQQRQIPFIDLYAAIDPLAGHGLAGDGLHLEAYAEGACILDAAGLEHGYNVRNLVALQGLDRVAAVLVDDVDAIDAPARPRAGTGSAADPIAIDMLPFADARDSARIGAAQIDAYGCGPRDESGPEVWYRLELASAKRLRLVVLDREGVDVDLNLLDATADPVAGCIARHDRVLEGTLAAGLHHVVVDTWSGADGPLPGEYLLVVTECEADDSACDLPL